MYLLRFKQPEQPYMFLERSLGQSTYPYVLTFKQENAAHFNTQDEVRSVITELSKLTIPKNVFDFDESTLFLIRLFGSSRDDQLEGLLVYMDDIIKAQVLDSNGTVVETVRLRNPVWEKHYA